MTFEDIGIFVVGLLVIIVVVLIVMAIVHSIFMILDSTYNSCDNDDDTAKYACVLKES